MSKQAPSDQAAPAGAATIVAASDFSAAADIAAGRAARLAKSLGADLLLIHVHNPGIWQALKGSLLPGKLRLPVELAEIALNERVTKLAADSGAEVRGLILEGSSATAAIADFIDATPTRLLIVGQRGENASGGIAFGSTALKLLRSVKVPVLATRAPLAADYARIVVASDFSACSERLAKVVPDLFPAARCVLMHAYMLPYEGRMRLAGVSDAAIRQLREQTRCQAESAISAFTQRLGSAISARYLTQLSYGFPAAVILEEAIAQRADLVAMGRHSGGARNEFLFGSVTQNVLHHLGCDLLLMP